MNQPNPPFPTPPYHKSSLKPSWELQDFAESGSLDMQPLYEAARDPLTEPLDLDKPIKTPFLKLQQALLQAPALSLSTLDDTFKLYVTERGEMALGVLGQM
jgi:hypothetical protein